MMFRSLLSLAGVAVLLPIARAQTPPVPSWMLGVMDTGLVEETEEVQSMSEAVTGTDATEPHASDTAPYINKFRGTWVGEFRKQAKPYSATFTGWADSTRMVWDFKINTDEQEAAFTLLVDHVARIAVRSTEVKGEPRATWYEAYAPPLQREDPISKVRYQASGPADTTMLGRDVWTIGWTGTYEARYFVDTTLASPFVDLYAVAAWPFEWPYTALRYTAEAGVSFPFLVDHAKLLLQITDVRIGPQALPLLGYGLGDWLLDQ
jgi:hypothetical protein